MPISILAANDSALTRNLPKEIIQADPKLRLVGCAPNAFVARDLIKQYVPDVISLDAEMPRMDGLTSLDKSIRARPAPVLTISSLIKRGSEVILRALELSAVDFIAKPRPGIAEGMQAYAEEIRAKLKTVVYVRLRRRAADAPVSPESVAPLLSTEKIIALGASTGGTETLEEVLLGLPTHSPGVVITQYMFPGFIHNLVERLDRLTRLSVNEACDGDRILPGHALVALGDHYVEMQRSDTNYVVRLSRQAQVNGHRPVVDVMFESLARCAGRSLLAGLLTDMGKNGACGLLATRQAGGYTLAQDGAACMAYGMPYEVVGLGAAEDMLPLRQVVAALLQQAVRRGSGNRLQTGSWLARCAFSPPPATSPAEALPMTGPDHGPLPARHHCDARLMAR